MFDVLLSAAAERDLEEIFDYTLNEFGLDQAEKYTLEFQDSFDQLVVHPQSGRLRNEVKEGIRSLQKGSHIIFFRILHDHILIVRILHMSRDVQRFI